jgi:DNA topoisomerase-1
MKGFGRMRAIMNRAASMMSYRLHVASANLWRDQYNPLRALTIRRAVTLLEEGERGAFADLQWTYRFIEMQDPTLGALIERRTSAMQELDWDIKLRQDLPEAKRAVAERQQQALRDGYERIENLNAAIEALSMASFRGYAHLEKVQDGNGNIIELAPVDQWFWVRRGLYGDWTYNQDSSMGKVDGEPVPLPRFVIREVNRPINRVALICFVRKGLSQKDWDGFIETFGIPAVFIMMPDNVPADKEDDYLAAADAVSSDARGVLPGGSDVKTVDNGARGTNPFKEHIDYQDSQLVLRGTGGKLTMLNEATGLGSGNAEAHGDTFASIAKAEAKQISEILREQIDAEILAEVTPGEKAWAYFEIAANEETDTGEVVDGVVKINSAGYRVKPEWLAEKTGYELEETPVAESEESKKREILNRLGLILNGYNPLQARAPKGARGGGRWTATGSGSKGSRAVRGEMRKGSEEDRKRLGVAPAFKDLEVTDDQTADLLATAKNAKGKTVYFYSEAYSKSQAAAKFARIGALNQAMPGLQAQIDRDILAGGPEKEQALALRMISITGLRNGGDDGGGKVPTYGASNLTPDMARVEGDTVRLNFVGKKGIAQRHSFEDAQLARHITAKQQAGAARIFDGDASKTLGYLKKISNNKFKVHDLRTWNGTMLADATAAKIAAKGELPTTEKEFKAFRKRVGKVVGRQLGNDANMSLRAYIHPLIFDPYEPKILTGNEAA